MGAPRVPPRSAARLPALHQLRRWDTAARVLQEVVRWEPKRVDAWLLLASCQQHLGRERDADFSVERARAAEADED